MTYKIKKICEKIFTDRLPTLDMTPSKIHTSGLLSGYASKSLYRIFLLLFKIIFYMKKIKIMFSCFGPEGLCPDNPEAIHTRVVETGAVP